MPKPEEIPSSDIEEEEAYVSRPGDVYLAFIDTSVKENDELTIEDTFIGGSPIWLHPDSVPSDDLLKCGSCKKPDNMRLLLQAFSPLDYEQLRLLQKEVGINNMNYINTNDDRILYVFMCTSCQRRGNSVRCIRGVKKNKSNATAAIAEKMNSVSLGKDFQTNPFDMSKQVDSNPFGANPFQNNTSSNPFGASIGTKKPEKTLQEKDSEVSAKTARKYHDSQSDKQFDSEKTFKQYLLYVEEESFKNKKPDHLKIPKNVKIDKDALDLTGDNEELLEKNPVKLDPRTEKLSKFLDDDIFQKFQEVVGYNPLQVLRYDIGGKPLFYAESKIDLEKTVPAPGYNPSSRRIFEMQLMPKMILDLEENVSLDEGMEWGTVLIFTDVENYIPKFDEHNVGYVEECVKVQWESRT
ncbi:small subunit rRNA maturation protein TSR4 NDAI_0G06020 [Naumovozyma dairenensis CBS 421]|uniref:Programmed cell death protein 2 C-terminal domain-containing protein n=1 Tax=Naumovozyma dairenensis (strain ATCC 10597 / BCRC 20456 / CBS 421 / NBRC 0211 / NRRL Y-12639) TaxID=1071378 RepID=J7SBU9_NAUDC|nr:hypothetical protein NDAI_0G06020 [Naumovozyma dairenensis CBS 421]CCK73585.1 hypothetical protein NDAI_0G06020 [Naumovozyma dairenensis CBS 421]